LVLCGVDTDSDPQDTWLETVKARLHEDLRSFRTDIESDHDQIEEWDFRDGRIFASIGSFDDQAKPGQRPRVAQPTGRLERQRRNGLYTRAPGTAARRLAT
jgi:hypothetical protein